MEAYWAEAAIWRQKVYEVSPWSLGRPLGRVEDSRYPVRLGQQSSIHDAENQWNNNIFLEFSCNIEGILTPLWLHILSFFPRSKCYFDFTTVKKFGGSSFSVRVSFSLPFWCCPL
jgi:hypothetical protein